MVARKLLALMLVTGGLAMLMVPTASAQDQSITTTLNCPSGDEIRPLGPPGQWTCTAEVTWAAGLSDPVTPVSVQIQASNPQPWMSVIISPNSMTMTPPNNPDDAGGTATETREFQVSVSLTQNAPAFLATQLQLQPSTTPADQNAQSTSDNPTQLTVTPGYFNLYNVALDQKIQEGGPDSSVTYPIVLDNFSNGDTRFEFTLANGDNVPSGYQPVPPEPVIVRSQATGGEQTQGQATFQVFTPFSNGYVNRIASMSLIVDSFYAADTNIEGASSQVSTLTKTKGFYVPGPGPALTALGMLGVALALTKGRQRIE